MNATDSVLFREEQRFRHPWLWALLLATVIVPTTIVARLPSNRMPAGVVALLIGAVLIPLAVMWFARLEVEVRADGVRFRFLPFHLRWHFIPIADMSEHAARVYSPLGEYGGWGIRGFASNRAYNVSGNRGVQLVLRDGRRVLFGSQNADDFDEALTIAGVHGT